MPSWTTLTGTNTFRLRVIVLALSLAGRHLCGQTAADSSPLHIDKPFVQMTIDSMTRVIRQEYVDADVAFRVNAYLRKCLADGHYQQNTTDELAKALTQDLFASSHDKHLFMIVSTGAAKVSQSPTQGTREQMARSSNFGVRRVEILPGNIGYLNLTSFYRPKEARGAFVSAMQLLAHADALVLDLRENNGGSPDMAVLVASFMFDKPGLPLFSIAPRAGKPMRWVTVQTPPPGSNEKRPLYVLTSEDTWSAGEGLAFLLQERHRAEIIGQTTAGAANPGRPYRVNGIFDINVPNGRVKSAVLGRNWEGVGVVPDVPTPATDSLHVAHTRALRRLIDLTPSGWQHDELERELQASPER
jgi:Peptidase family S41/N-terminal domain of Peptidase_S41 in eukaryotic IRBP